MQLGYPEHPTNGPRLPWRVTSGLPQLGHVSPVASASARLAVLDVLAVGEARTAHELAELPFAHDQPPDLALGALLAGLARRDADALHRPLGALEGCRERLVPLTHGRLVRASALLHGVEPFLEVRGEGDVDDVGEVLAEHGVNGLAELGRMQAALQLATRTDAPG